MSLASWGILAFSLDHPHLASSKGRQSMKWGTRSFQALNWSGSGRNQFFPHPTHQNSTSWPHLNAKGLRMRLAIWSGMGEPKFLFLQLSKMTIQFQQLLWISSWPLTTLQNEKQQQSPLTVLSGLERLLLSLY